MVVILTLSEILDKCNDWEDFCEKEGWSVWAVNEGGGDIEVTLSEDKCHEYGIIKRDRYSY